MIAKQNETYDIVLANGRVIDPETYLDGKMHVGIKGDRIAAVSESPTSATAYFPNCSRYRSTRTLNSSMSPSSTRRTTVPSLSSTIISYRDDWELGGKVTG